MERMKQKSLLNYTKNEMKDDKDVENVKHRSWLGGGRNFLGIGRAPTIE